MSASVALHFYDIYVSTPAATKAGHPAGDRKEKIMRAAAATSKGAI